CGRFSPGMSSTAMSTVCAMPSTRASTSLPFASETRTLPARPTTCAFVMMRPSGLMMTPEPEPVGVRIPTTAGETSLTMLISSASPGVNCACCCTATLLLVCCAGAPLHATSRAGSSARHRLNCMEPSDVVTGRVRSTIGALLLLHVLDAGASGGDIGDAAPETVSGRRGDGCAVADVRAVVFLEDLRSGLGEQPPQRLDV